MSTVSRRIEISGSDAGFGRMASNLADDLQRSFESANEELERMSGNATDFTEILEGRMGAIETSVQQAFAAMQRRLDQQRLSGNERIRQMREELTQAERALRIETERARLAEKMRFQNRMRDAVDAKNKEQFAMSTDKTPKASKKPSQSRYFNFGICVDLPLQTPTTYVLVVEGIMEMKTRTKTMKIKVEHMQQCLVGLSGLSCREYYRDLESPDFLA
jgi:hypothetical protein